MAHFPTHHHDTRDRQSASKTTAPMQKVTREVQLWPPPLPLHPWNIKHSRTEHTHRAGHAAGIAVKHAWFPRTSKKHGGFWPRRLLSGGTRSLCGQPDRLRWWGYRPVTWPVPSQPGVGHRLSFLSAREASEGREESRWSHVTQVTHGQRPPWPHCGSPVTSELPMAC